jgi:hypothetical protein
MTDLPPGPWTVALVMIVRDEAQHIDRVLRSAQPWVDQMWVLDTGSTDHTPALARACGAQVAHSTWTDDFSAARNQALSLAKADWHLILDADEYLHQGGELIAALRHQAPNFVGALRVDSDYDLAGGIAVAPSWISRVLPGSVRYSGRIHEQPQHSLPVRRLEVVVAHDGYRQHALDRKRGRNARLLQHALADHPDDPYLWFQLGKDHDVHERYAQALDCFARVGPSPGGSGGAAPWAHDLVVRSLHALKRCGRHGDGMALAQAEMAQWSHSPDFFFALGDLLLDWAADEPARAADLLPLIEQAWNECLVLGERPDLEGSVQGRGSFLAAHNLALLKQALGEGDAEPSP